LLCFEVVIERSAIASQRVPGAIDPILVLLLCNWHGYFTRAAVDATFNVKNARSGARFASVFVACG
jgi:hypothetical protein